MDTMNCQYDSDQLVGLSAAMIEVFRLIKICAESDCRTILISGESGTGKELVARTIHMRSCRCNAPFLDVDCASILENQLEEELFGCEKVVCSDGSCQEKGVFDYADEGTVFLGEVGDMPLFIQRKILKVLEARSFRRVGGQHNLEANVRIIAATNQDLKKSVESGVFRGDLYCRLNVMRIFLPPLRERRECIPGLVDYFIGRINAVYGKNVQGVESSTMTCLQQYDWPGNVRELRNALEHAMVLDTSPLLTSEYLPIEVRRGGKVKSRHDNVVQIIPQNSVNKHSGITLPPDGIALEGVEKKLIEQALLRFAGNQTKAARCLDMSRDTLRYRMKKFGLARE